MTPTTNNPIIELETIVLITQNKWNGFHIEIVVCFAGGKDALLSEIKEGGIWKFWQIQGH